MGLNTSGIALNYMMDKGLTDATPKTGLAPFLPTGKGNVAASGLLTNLSTSQGSAGNTVNGMTTFERDARGSDLQKSLQAPASTPEGVPATFEQTQFEKQMRESAQKNGQTPPSAGAPSEFPKGPGLKFNENGDVAFGDSGYKLRWNKLPPVAQHGVAAIVASEVPGGLLPQFTVGEIVDNYLDNNFRYPTLELPATKDIPSQSSPPVTAQPDSY